MILLKILYRDVILQEQTRHLGLTSLVRALSFPMSKMTNRNNVIFHCFTESFLIYSSEVQV